MAKQYQMQAKDSTTGLLHSWLTSGPDFAALHYDGPGTALDVTLYSAPDSPPGPVVSATGAAQLSTLTAAGIASVQAISFVQSFNVAEVSSLGVTKFFSAVDGVAGHPPQIDTGSSVVFLIKNPTTGGCNVAEFGNLASSRGWMIGVTSGKQLLVRARGGADPNLASDFVRDSYLTACAFSITGGKVRASINGGAVQTGNWPTYTPASSGDTFTLGKTADGVAVPTTINVFAVFNRVLSDTELKAISNRANADNRYAFEDLASDASCTLFWSFNDWDGSAATHVTRGTSPLTLTKNGAPVKTSFTEVRRELSSTNGDFRDSVRETITGSGQDLFRRGQPYGIFACRAPSSGSNELVLDVISDSVFEGSIDQYKNGAYVQALGGSQGILQDAKRRTYTQPFATNGALYEHYTSSNSNNMSFAQATVKAIRYRTSNPWTVEPQPTGVTSVLGFYGDSISQGYNAVDTKSGFVRIVRSQYPGRVFSEGSGGRRFSDGPSNIAQQLCDSFNQYPGAAKILWIEMGRNDWALGPNGTVTPFSNLYAQRLNEIHAIDSTIVIYCQSMWLEKAGGEIPNAGGVLPSAFRTAVQNVVAAHTGGTAIYVDGLGAGLLDTDFYDEPHPNTSGHAKLAAFVKATLGY